MSVEPDLKEEEQVARTRLILYGALGVINSILLVVFFMTLTP